MRHSFTPNTHLSGVLLQPTPKVRKCRQQHVIPKATVLSSANEGSYSGAKVGEQNLQPRALVAVRVKERLLHLKHARSNTIDNQDSHGAQLHSNVGRRFRVGPLRDAGEASMLICRRTQGGEINLILA